MTKKYELTKNTIEVDGRTLYQIVALKDLPSKIVRKGTLGGYVEKESNLSQEGDCWIYGNAKVMKNSHVSESAVIYDNAIIAGGKVVGKAVVKDHAQIRDGILVADSAMVGGHAICEGSAIISDNAFVNGDTKIITKPRPLITEISGNAKVNCTRIGDEVTISGNTFIMGDISVNEATLEGKCEISGSGIHIEGVEINDGKIGSNALIQNPKGYLVVSNLGEDNKSFTAYRTHDGRIRCTHGFFEGSLDQFESATKDFKAKDLQSYAEYQIVIALVKLRWIK